MITVVYIGEEQIPNLLTEQIREESNIHLVGLIPYKNNILGILGELDPRVVILSLNQPSSISKQIKENHPNAKIIALVREIDIATYFEIIENVDVVLESIGDWARIVIDSISSGHNNYFHMPSNLVKSFMRKLEELKSDNFNLFHKRLAENGVTLSIREAEIACLARKNMRNKQIAEILQITEGTVKVHISKIYKKINTKGRRNMVNYLNRIMSNGQEKGDMF